MKSCGWHSDDWLQAHTSYDAHTLRSPHVFMAFPKPSLRNAIIVVPVKEAQKRRSLVTIV